MIKTYIIPYIYEWRNIKICNVWEMMIYLLFRHFQGLEVVTDDAQLFFQLHDFPVHEREKGKKKQ